MNSLMKYKEKNPRIFWGSSFAFVIVIIAVVALVVGLQPSTQDKPTDKPKGLDERAAEIINRPSTVENFDDPIICPNIRNENYKNAIMLFLDIMGKEEARDLLTLSRTNYIVKDGDKIIMDLKGEEEKQNFVVSELLKIRKLMETLDKKFGNNANYVHLFFIIRDYLTRFSGDIKDEDDLDEQQKLKMIDIFAPAFLFSIIYMPFEYYVTNRADWSDDIFTYENNKLEFNPTNIKNYNAEESSEIGNFAKRSVGKSVKEMITEILSLSKGGGPRPNQPNINKLTLNKIDYENDDFINTFNGLNTSCMKTSDKEYYKKKFKYSEIFKINSQYTP